MTLILLHVWISRRSATTPYLVGTALLGLGDLLLILGAGSLRDWAVRFLVRVQELRHGDALAAGGAAFLFLLASSAQLSVISLGVLPFYGCFFSVRGWPAARSAALWVLAAVVLSRGATAPLIALLPLAVVFLRRRPALVWGCVLLLAVALRLSLSISVPGPFWYPDSHSYVEAVHVFLAGEPLRLGAMAAAFELRPTSVPVVMIRTPTYPLFVLGALWTSGSYFIYTLAAHALGLGAALWVGLRLRRVLGELAGWHAFTMMALSPELIFYEHALLTESMSMVCLSVLSLLVVRLLGEHEATPGEAWVLGFWAAATALARPVTQVAVPLLLAGALLRGWRTRRVACFLLGLSLTLGAWGLHNRLVYGRFHLSSPGLRVAALFAISGHMTVLDSPSHAEIKSEMRPAIERHNRMRPPWDPFTNYLIWAPDGPLRSSPTLMALSMPERVVVIRDLAHEAIWSDPGAFLQRAAFQVLKYFTDDLHDRFAMPNWSDAQTLSSPPPGTPEALTHAAVGLGAAGRRALYERFVLGMSRRLERSLGEDCVIARAPFSLYKHPVFFLLMFMLALMVRPRWRVPLGVLAAICIALLLMVTVLQEPIERYRLQVFPMVVIGVSVLFRRGDMLSSAPTASGAARPTRDSATS